MSGELTPKQEAFVAAFLETGNAAQAYRQSYDVAEDAKDNWIYVEACQLLDNPKVALKLKQLREQAERLSIFNVAKAMEEFEEARKDAKTAGNASAMVAATAAKVKLLGLDKPQRAVVGSDPANPLKVKIEADEAFADFARQMAIVAAAAASRAEEAG